MSENEYLAHHGIKGQKWGVRRYQNPDGSLTPAGRDHYGLDSKKYFTPNVKATAARSAASSAKSTAITNGLIGVAATGATAALAPSYAPMVGAAWLAESAVNTGAAAAWGAIAGTRGGHAQDMRIREACEDGRAFTVTELTFNRKITPIPHL
jgi:hypothetical protein